MSGFKLRSGNKSPFKLMGSSPVKVDPSEYKGETESSTANRNIRRGKQEKQRTYVEGINEKLGSTKKEKRAQKRVMNKSEKIRKREARQEDREKRTKKNIFHFGHFFMGIKMHRIIHLCLQARFFK